MIRAGSGRERFEVAQFGKPAPIRVINSLRDSLRVCTFWGPHFCQKGNFQRGNVYSVRLGFNPAAWTITARKKLGQYPNRKGETPPCERFFARSSVSCYLFPVTWITANCMTKADSISSCDKIKRLVFRNWLKTTERMLENIWIIPLTCLALFWQRS